MKVLTIEELKKANNGDVFIDEDGVVYHYAGDGEFYTPGRSATVYSSEVTFPLMKVYPLE